MRKTLAPSVIPKGPAGRHVPLKVLVELLADAVDAGPVELLVQGVGGFVWRRDRGA